MSDEGFCHVVGELLGEGGLRVPGGASPRKRLEVDAAAAVVRADDDRLGGLRAQAATARGRTDVGGGDPAVAVGIEHAEGGAAERGLVEGAGGSIVAATNSIRLTLPSASTSTLWRSARGRRHLEPLVGERRANVGGGEHARSRLSAARKVSTSSRI